MWAKTESRPRFDWFGRGIFGRSPCRVLVWVPTVVGSPRFSDEEVVFLQDGAVTVEVTVVGATT
jgi:hypothetical protein